MSIRQYTSPLLISTSLDRYIINLIYIQSMYICISVSWHTQPLPSCSPLPPPPPPYHYSVRPPLPLSHPSHSLQCLPDIMHFVSWSLAQNPWNRHHPARLARGLARAAIPSNWICTSDRHSQRETEPVVSAMLGRNCNSRVWLGSMLVALAWACSGDRRENLIHPDPECPGAVLSSSF